MFEKILIANRGEIACRVMDTARAMGVQTVAVYSDADARARHVAMADEAVHIGPPAAAESYLLGDRIIKAALDTGARAIHPGYGFLSENPKFVQAVEKAGLVFIGPPAKAIRAMGLKDAAKKLMEKAGVPVVPGYHGDNQDAKFLAKQAAETGYPVLIKARAGGGGKGMRRVDDPRNFKAGLEGAVREGEASFGDGHVLIEKYITAPRHIEIQVFGDNHGNAVHLFERDCSLQRRHQKVIEEAPAPGMTEEMRKAMGDAAVKAAKAIGYSGAGTIEFIVDGSKGLKPDGFWFMEMNTRLQVEHPVSEAITGVDLVEWQLRVAYGETLPLTQDELAIRGHAFEARLYAEDVPKGFLPATGTLRHLEFSKDARNETGVRSQDTITPFYDPMIAKVIVHGETRGKALKKMQQALAKTEVAGTVTNLAFLSALMKHDGFSSGKVDTGLIERDLDDLVRQPDMAPETLPLAALLASGVLRKPEGQDPFDLCRNHVHWRATPVSQILLQGGTPVELKLLAGSGGAWNVSWPDREIVFDSISTDGKNVRYETDGHSSRCRFHLGSSLVTVFSQEGTFEFGIPDPLLGSAAGDESSDRIIAPMPGLVKQVVQKAGAKLAKGDAVMVLEAMKMEHTLTAPRDGVLESIAVKAGDQVEDGNELAAMEPEDG